MWVCKVVGGYHVGMGLSLGSVSVWELVGCFGLKELFVYFKFPIGIRARWVLPSLGLNLFNLVT